MGNKLDIDGLPARLQALAARMHELEHVTALEMPEDAEPAAFDEVESVSKQVHELLEVSIQPVMTDLEAALKTMQSAVDAAAELARDSQADVETQVAKIVQASTAFDAHVADQCKQIRDRAYEEYFELHSELLGLHSASRLLVDKADAFAQSLPQHCGKFSKRVATEATMQIEQHAQQAGAALEALLGSMSAQLRATAGTLDAELQTQFGRLDQAASSGIRNHIESAGQRIVESALRQIANSIQASIMQMTVGMQLTSMMSPILPQMIVLNKCADALLEAIEVYKNLRTMGGIL